MNSHEIFELLNEATKLVSERYNNKNINNFKSIIKLLNHHEITAVAAHIIKNDQEWIENLSENQLQVLNSSLREAQIRYQLVTGALHDCLSVLSGLKILFFKGLTLSELYPEPYLRNPGDLDFLVSPEDFQEAAWRLKKNNWILQESVHRDRNYKTAGKYGFALVFRHPSRPVIVDLHRAVIDKTEPFWINTRDLFEEKVLRKLSSGVTVSTLCAEDHLAIVALHSVRHGFFRLGWFYDVHLACQQWTDTIDRDMFYRRCKKWKILKAVRTSLEISKLIYGTQNHPLNNIYLNNQTRKAIEKRNLSVIAHGHLIPSGGWRRIISMTDLLENRWEWIKYLINIALPRREIFSTVHDPAPGFSEYVINRFETFSRLLQRRR